MHLTGGQFARKRGDDLHGACFIQSRQALAAIFGREHEGPFSIKALGVLVGHQREVEPSLGVGLEGTLPARLRFGVDIGVLLSRDPRLNRVVRKLGRGVGRSILVEQSRTETRHQFAQSKFTFNHGRVRRCGTGFGRPPGSIQLLRVPSAQLQVHPESADQVGTVLFHGQGFRSTLAPISVFFRNISARPLGLHRHREIHLAAVRQRDANGQCAHLRKLQLRFVSLRVFQQSPDAHALQRGELGVDHQLGVRREGRTPQSVLVIEHDRREAISIAARGAETNRGVLSGHTHADRDHDVFHRTTGRVDHPDCDRVFRQRGDFFALRRGLGLARCDRRAQIRLTGFGCLDLGWRRRLRLEDEPSRDREQGQDGDQSGERMPLLAHGLIITRYSARPLDR